MDTLTLKIPPDLTARLEKAARERGATKSALVREAIVAYLSQEPEGLGESFLAAAKDIVGSVSGPRDLSTHPKHMRGYGG